MFLESCDMRECYELIKDGMKFRCMVWLCSFRIELLFLIIFLTVDYYGYKYGMELFNWLFDWLLLSGEFRQLLGNYIVEFLYCFLYCLLLSRIGWLNHGCSNIYCAVILLSGSTLNIFEIRSFNSSPSMRLILYSP